MPPRWPPPTSDDIMKAWAGLGYYSRARNLKKCADIVARDHGAAFPDTVEGLRALPGIGGYTAAAIAAIAFDRPAAVVDGNVERVVARIEAIETPLPAAKPLIHAIVEQLVPASRPGDFAQAMMDLGATICTPRKPSCMICPLNDDCAALRLGDPERFPYKAPKMERPQRVGAAFVAVRGDGAVLLRKRDESGLLGGMAEVPTTDWTARRDGAVDADAAPFAADWRFAGRIAHVFTHFALDLAVFRADVGERDRTCRPLVVGAGGDPWRGLADRHEEGNRSCHTRHHQTQATLIRSKQEAWNDRNPPHRLRHRQGADPLRPQSPFSRLIPDADERRWFFENVCTPDWNIEQDRGRTWEEAEALLVAVHPDA